MLIRSLASKQILREKLKTAGRLCLVILSLVVITSCSTINSKNTSEFRRLVDSESNKYVKEMLNKQPALKKELDVAPAHMICNSSITMLGPVGGESGLCVLIERNNATKTYLNLKAFSIGMGAGSVNNRVLVLFYAQDLINKIKRNHTTIHSQALTALGDNSTTLEFSHRDYKIIVDSQSGAGIGASVDLVKLNVNTTLTDIGLTESSFPTKSKRHVAPTKNQLTWNRKLPFLAQQVIDRGYRLPNPYGLGYTRAGIQQDMTLTGLEVGFGKQPIVPYDWVSFDNANTDLVTNQIKFDAWLLPFMNVFAMLGKVQGDITLDAMVQGDGLLELLGEDCNMRPIPLACRVLAGQLIDLPIRTDVQPTTYGVGAIVAGGWHNWFVTVPINITWSDSDYTNIHGQSTTVTPRGGKQIDLPSLGKLALFIGGNYLDSRNKVSGTIIIPGTDIPLNYRIRQKNTDKWNLVAGFNWDVTRNLSLNAEYNGYTGSRETVIAGIVLRF